MAKKKTSQEKPQVPLNRRAEFFLKTVERSRSINEGKLGRPYGIANAATLDAYLYDYIQSHKRSVITKDGLLIDVDAPMTELGFCLWCGHSERWLDYLEKTLREKERNEDEEELFRSVQRARSVLRNDLMEGAVAGLYQQNIVARILGLGEKVEQTGESRVIVVKSEDEKKKIEDIGKLGV